MKKISLFLACAIALLVVSCKMADNKDKNGNTPTTVVEEMYKNIQEGAYDKAAEFCKIPDSIDKEVWAKYVEQDPAIKDMLWKEVVINKMNKQKEGFELKEYKVVKEEISKTDPDNANVKTTITIVKDGVESNAECAFPLKREEGVWRIIG